mmetsp:Transcript_85614/g.220396  ORF Transcript_85614/g.220396 Transcript_85614/m.220396 type:complete len:105 (-) Transcript_85614:1184-1498(-)
MFGLAPQTVTEVISQVSPRSGSPFSGTSLAASIPLQGRKSPQECEGPAVNRSPMKKISEKRKEYNMVTHIRSAILKKNVKKQRNINAPEPAVVSAPAKTVDPMF